MSSNKKQVPGSKSDLVKPNQRLISASRAQSSQLPISDEARAHRKALIRDALKASEKLDDRRQELEFTIGEQEELQAELDSTNLNIKTHVALMKDSTAIITEALRKAQKVLDAADAAMGSAKAELRITGVRVAKTSSPFQDIKQEQKGITLLIIARTPARANNLAVKWKPTAEELESFSEAGTPTPSGRHASGSGTQHPALATTPSPTKEGLGHMDNTISQGSQDDDSLSQGSQDDAQLSFPPTPSQNTVCYAPAMPKQPRNGTQSTAASNVSGIEVLSTPPTPGGSIIAANFTPINTTPGQMCACYIVYIGNGGGHGLFKFWSSAYGRPPAHCGKNLVQGYKDAVWKGFRDAERAVQYYKEVKDWGIFPKIAEYIRAKYTGRVLFFIVTKGVSPGVYSGLNSLIHQGLQYRGSQVHTFGGTKTQAIERYDEFVINGQVEYFPGVPGGHV
ncbi:hypothetical protein V5O48_014727 [Marasmius crinis-equi]|uniref:Uncharacterized protein n=1 Tax=Marasmius crinis-equi TaxID=585013 RepID=A0ABR3EWT6_9AGAR